MKRIHVVVEGQTENGFIFSVMRPYFETLDVYLNPVLVETKSEVAGSHHRGGYVTYPKVRRQIRRLLSDSSAILVTTMFDYYGLSRTFPGRGDVAGITCHDQVRFCEDAFSKDIDHRKFLPYFQLHEFEAFLFVSPKHTADILGMPEIARELGRIREHVNSPEEINDDPTTAPSKRITGVYPLYDKVFHGPSIARHVGLSALRHACPHFNDWVTALESICTD